MKRNSEVLEMGQESKSNETLRCAAEYKDKIIEMLESIESIERLIKIYTVVETHLKLQNGEI